MKYIRIGAFLGMLAGIFLFAASAHAADYYVSTSGSDTNSGTQSAPWKTIGKVNGKAFAAGDRIFFAGGQTFSGMLYFDSSDKGTASSRITISSYGTGRAMIQGGSSEAFYAYNTAGITIDNINFAGSGSTSNTKSGVFFYADASGGVKYDGITITNSDMSGFGGYGITIGGYNGTTGFKNVSISKVNVHDNADGGIIAYGPALTSGYAHQNINVSYVKAYNNHGIPTKGSHTGNGILIGSVDGATIERSVAYNNGAKNTADGGPVGIWAYDANNVVIQYNESYSNKTNSTADGGGFDLDGGVTNSVMQYNYSHDNDGAGYGLYQYTGARTFSNNIVRYNISQNDGRKNGYGGISFWNGGSGISNVDVYNNVVYVGGSPLGTPSAINFMKAVKNVRVYNNIFITENNLPLVKAVSGQSGVSFRNNHFWSKGGTYTYSWAEMSRDSLVQGDPKLAGAGTGGTLNDANSLASLTAYQLQSTSPAIDKGYDVRTFSTASAVNKDFYGNSVPQKLAFDIGVHETGFGSSSTTTSTSTATSTPTNPTATSTGSWVGKYYTSSSTGAFSNLVLTRTDAVINFNWGKNRPDTKVPADNFAVKWTGTFNFAEAGTYAFSATTDDGMRVWIDGKLVLDKWFNQSATKYTFTRTLTAGSHALEVHYYEKSSNAVAKFSWVKSTTAAFSGRSFAASIYYGLKSVLDSLYGW